MSCCAEGSCSGDNFVEWAHVESCFRDDSVDFRDEMEQRKVREEFFGLRILEQMSRRVPSCSFKEHAVDVAACGRFLSDVSVTLSVDDIVSKSDLKKGRKKESYY